MLGLTPTDLLTRDSVNYEDEKGVVHAVTWVSHHDDYVVWIACSSRVITRFKLPEPNPRRHDLVDPIARPVDCMSCLATIIR